MVELMGEEEGRTNTYHQSLNLAIIGIIRIPPQISLPEASGTHQIEAQGVK
jgi:hypothetical protein